MIAQIDPNATAPAFTHGTPAWADQPMPRFPSLFMLEDDEDELEDEEFFDEEEDEDFEEEDEDFLDEEEEEEFFDEDEDEDFFDEEEEDGDL